MNAKAETAHQIAACLAELAAEASVAGRHLQARRLRALASEGAGLASWLTGVEKHQPTGQRGDAAAKMPAPTQGPYLTRYSVPSPEANP